MKLVTNFHILILSIRIIVLAIEFVKRESPFTISILCHVCFDSSRAIQVAIKRRNL